ncbi:transcription termination factor NusA [Desulfofustis glycolicus]|uniref:Transcription termination/antitermination protein NusA n=1 Tax=Desulfofustis glycolicus DSM 9705 TaxID=1121409 RepID=A0A1M5T1G2_9BACT|nr:transcription termination factor NusA [Desulfofustis glycolicus]MCB2215312.1 transcription termination factor NusA [Desulfobulbaceae bacterium]SHH44611.1 NusA antitermination factor [Desulfofustis glycolicus DSM 9705]
MVSDLKRIIDQISRDRGFDRRLLVEAIEEAVASAARKKYGSRRDIEVHYNEELGEVEVFQFRSVVEVAEDDQTEISFEAAKVLDPEVQLGDELGEKMENITELGRIAAQSAKQVIIHRMKDAERDVIYDMFKDRQGEVVSGIVQRFERGNMVVNLGRTDAILPKEHQIPKRSFKQGDRIRAYLLEVRQNSRDSQLILSRTADEFLEKLFQLEVPEIAEGIVKIMGVSREPGFRAKIAVSSSESDVDPVGACVGMKGSRVQNVVQELQGERIDIVTWSPDPAKYVYNALAPAHVSMVMVDEDANSLLVVVPNDQLSLAIGRQGQNVRLASKLMGWRIDVKSEQRWANLEDEGYQSLLQVPGIDENLADQLLAKEIKSVVDLARASAETLTIIRAIDEEYAAQLIDAAANLAGEEALAEAAEQEEKELAAAALREKAQAADRQSQAGDGPLPDATGGVEAEDTADEAGTEDAIDAVAGEDAAGEGAAEDTADEAGTEDAADEADEQEEQSPAAKPE